MGSRKAGVVIPRTKISMTILRFGEPLFARFHEIPPVDVLRSLLRIVITVWNAHVLAMPIWGQPQHLENVDRLLCGPDVTPWMAGVVAELSDRRRTRFKNDPRAVGEWTVEPGTDGLLFRCDARLPQAVLAGLSTNRPRRRASESHPPDASVRVIVK